MKHFIWSIPETLLPRTKKIITYQILIPKTFVKFDSSELYDSRIWLLMEGSKKLFLYAQIYVSSVEIIDDGAQIGNLLIGGDIDKSTYYYSTSKPIPGAWELNPRLFPDVLNTEIRLGTATSIQYFEKSIAQFIENRLYVNLKEIESISRSISLPKGVIGYKLTKELIRSLKARFSVGDLFRYARHTSLWGPYESIAALILGEIIYIKKDAIEDSVNTYIEQYVKAPERQPLMSVDTVLVPIDPDEIVARQFVIPPKAISSSVYLERLQKTDRAERIHQAILKDVALQLIHLGYKPHESRSVDLTVINESGSLLYEIKSSTIDNFFDQAMHGAMQVLHYKFALEQDGINVERSCVIIEQCKESDIEQYVSCFLATLGIPLLIYRDNLPWPERLHGLIPLD